MGNFSFLQLHLQTPCPLRLVTEGAKAEMESIDSTSISEVISPRCDFVQSETGTGWNVSAWLYGRWLRPSSSVTSRLASRHLGLATAEKRAATVVTGGTF